jgi:hypothetical protein
MRTVQVLGITGTSAFLLGRRVPGGDKIEVLEVVEGLLPYEEGPFWTPEMHPHASRPRRQPLVLTTRKPSGTCMVYWVLRDFL